MSIDGFVTYPVIDLTQKVFEAYLVTDTTHAFKGTYSVNFIEKKDGTDFYKILNAIYVIALLLGL